MIGIVVEPAEDSAQGKRQGQSRSNCDLMETTFRP